MNNAKEERVTDLSIIMEIIDGNLITVCSTEMSVRMAITSGTARTI